MRSAKHEAQLINTLRDYAFPIIGNRSVDEIEQKDIYHVLTPIWANKPPTARLFLQRLRTVLDWSRTAGYREGINPVERVEKGLPRQRDKAKHPEALPWREVPAVMERIKGVDRVGALALRLTILTAARPGEVRGARWEEIDWENAVWTIRAERMKGAEQHRVPLSPEALAILEAARGLDAELIFPGARRGKRMTDKSLGDVLRSLMVPATVHGFRSTLRDWAGECSSQPREVAEARLTSWSFLGRRGSEMARRKTLDDAHHLERMAWLHFLKPGASVRSLVRHEARHGGIAGHEQKLEPEGRRAKPWVKHSKPENRAKRLERAYRRLSPEDGLAIGTYKEFEHQRHKALRDLMGGYIYGPFSEKDRADPRFREAEGRARAHVARFKHLTEEETAVLVCRGPEIPGQRQPAQLVAEKGPVGPVSAVRFKTSAMPRKQAFANI